MTTTEIDLPEDVGRGVTDERYHGAVFADGAMQRLLDSQTL
jgi:hypothetical protein